MGRRVTRSPTPPSSIRAPPSSAGVSGGGLAASVCGGSNASGSSMTACAWSPSSRPPMTPAQSASTPQQTIIAAERSSDRSSPEEHGMDMHAGLRTSRASAFDEGSRALVAGSVTRRATGNPQSYWRRASWASQCRRGPHRHSSDRGTIVVQDRVAVHRVDARSSDAVAVALGFHAPIYVADAVVARTAVPRH